MGNLARRVKIFLDSADLTAIAAAASRVDGFTTNPTLMRAAGVTDYRAFVPAAIEAAGGKPISFEVIADTMAEMDRQARSLAEAASVYVKMPITTTDGTSCVPLVARLHQDGVRVNVTAVTTERQIRSVCAVLVELDTPSIVSVFAGRIADAGYSPRPFIESAVRHAGPATEILWASSREVFNVMQAQAWGAHIITLTPALLEKYSRRETNLELVSRATVQMFLDDAIASGFTL